MKKNNSGFPSIVCAIKVFQGIAHPAALQNFSTLGTPIEGTRQKKFSSLCPTYVKENSIPA